MWGEKIAAKVQAVQVVQVQVQEEDQNQWSGGGKKRTGTSIFYILLCPPALLLLDLLSGSDICSSFLIFPLYPDLRFPKIAGSFGLCSASGIVEEGRMCICGLMANLMAEYQLLVLV